MPHITIRPALPEDAAKQPDAAGTQAFRDTWVRQADQLPTRSDFRATLCLRRGLGRHSDVTTALAAFQSRRWERCHLVVENSLRLGEIEIANGDKDEHGQIMRSTLMALAAPI